MLQREGTETVFNMCSSAAATRVELPRTKSCRADICSVTGDSSILFRTTVRKVESRNGHGKGA